MSKLNLASLAVEATSTIHLRDAAGTLLTTPAIDAGGKPEPVTVTVYGPGSAEYAEAIAKRESRQLERLRKSRGKAEVTAEVKKRDEAIFLASITVEFSRNMEYGDGSLSGNELHRAIYSDRSIGFIADQIYAELADWENFMKGSATN
jgi:hypothetical protein